MAEEDTATFDPAAYDGVDLAAAAAAGAGVPPPFHAQRGYAHATWARTFGSRPELFIQPSTVAEVERVVRLARHRRRRVTTTGCGHSPSDMTCTSSWLVNLDRLNRVLAIDKTGGEATTTTTTTTTTATGKRPLVTVQAGIRLRDLSAALADEGLALPNLGSINAQSLAGALATGTHGSSLQHGLLSDDVTALRITLGDGRTVAVSRAESGDLFRAALLSLGALGIVVEITLRVVPAFRLRWSQTVDSDEVVFAAWRARGGECSESPESPESSESPETPKSPNTVLPGDGGRNSRLWTQAHFVRVWWFPYTRRAVVWTADDRNIAADEPDHVPPVSYYDSRFGYLIYHNLLYLARFVPRILPWVEWFVFGMQYGFRAGTTTAGLQPGDHALLMNCLYSQYVNEWAIPLARGPEALARLGAWLNRLKPGDPAYVDHRIPFSADGLYVHAPVEVRVTDTAPDSFAAHHDDGSSDGVDVDTPNCRPLLDPTVSDGPTLYLNAIMYRPYFTDPPGTGRYYEAFEWLMRDIGGRPHWAKCFGASHADLAASYGSDLQRFLDVRQAADPDGLFVGPWHRRYLLGSDVAPLPLEEHESSRAVAVDNSVFITGELAAPAEL